MSDDPAIPIPVPDRSGSSGNQLAADQSQVFIEARPLHGLHMASTIEGLASTNPRAFGNEVAVSLLGAYSRQAAFENNDLRMENRRLLDRIDSMRDTLEIERISNGVLSEKIKSEGKNKHLRNFCITVGTGAIGIGITLARAGQDGYAIGTVVVGVLLLLLGWFSGPKGEKA